MAEKGAGPEENPEAGRDIKLTPSAENTERVFCSYADFGCSYGVLACSYPVFVCSYQLSACSYGLPPCSYGQMEPFLSRGPFRGGLFTRIAGRRGQAHGNLCHKLRILPREFS